MGNRTETSQHDNVGAWAKRCYFAGRALMDAVLHPYNIGSTQWYVLHQLASVGPTKQRDLVQFLQIERATLSSIVAALVRKGLIEQVPDSIDQRQRTLRLTTSGKKLWKQLPDLGALILSIAFEGFDQKELSITRRVLETATERLNLHVVERNRS
jgi:DNA-binding MarR family transcriptional regulator